MSQITSINQELLDAYLKKIGYSEIVSNMPQEKLIVVDWPAITREIPVGSSFLYKRCEESVSIVSGVKKNDLVGVYSSTLFSGDDSLSVEVYYFQTRKNALDYMLKRLSLISASSINKEFYVGKKGFGEYAAMSSSGQRDSAYTVYGNILIYVDRGPDSNLDVANVVQYIIQEVKKLETSGGALNSDAEGKLNIVVSKQKITPTDEFRVKVDTDRYPEESWKIKLATGYEKLEYIDNEFGEFRFRALESGEEELTFGVTNVVTLRTVLGSIGLSVQ